MTAWERIKKRWHEEESIIGKKLKFWGGYCGVAGGVVLEAATTYMPYVKEFVSEGLSHKLFGAGIILFLIGKLTKKQYVKENQEGKKAG